uniref:Uncharacterized protein n=1 Tax=Strigamia maritima TaxID=126957 RepID=T1IQ99_STRMM
MKVANTVTASSRLALGSYFLHVLPYYGRTCFYHTSAKQEVKSNKLPRSMIIYTGIISILVRYGSVYAWVGVCLYASSLKLYLVCDEFASARPATTYSLWLGFALVESVLIAALLQSLTSCSLNNNGLQKLSIFIAIWLFSIPIQESHM